MDISSLITQVADVHPEEISLSEHEGRSDNCNRLQLQEAKSNEISSIAGDQAELAAAASNSGGADAWRQRKRRLLDSRLYRAACRLCCGCSCRAAAGVGAGQPQQQRRQLLPPQAPDVAGRICAVIDLDETLVHSSFKRLQNADFVISVNVDGLLRHVYVMKRPFLDQFLQRIGELFECVLFTASLAKYADPVADRLDKFRIFRHRLFREACVVHNGSFVKDLSLMGRPLHRCLIVDNSPVSYMFNRENAIQIKSWLGDRTDTELRDLLPRLQLLAAADSVPQLLATSGSASSK